MKFARFVAADGSVEVGVVTGEEIEVVPGPGDVLPLLGTGAEGLEAAAREAHRHGGRRPAVEVRYLAPLATPPSVRDFYAFEQHVRAGRAARGLDMDPDWYELPVFYFSNPYAMIGCGDVRMSPGTSQFDFELEVAAVLGGGGRDLTPAEGEELIAGFCVMNDWSGRDIQAREMKLSLGPVKGKDTATGLGPWLVTADEIRDRREGAGYSLRMQCSVNGALYSDADWSDVYWSFGEMVAYASRGTEVKPGDVIGSGTCGTGCILELSQGPDGERFPWLRPGDEVVASVEGLGYLRNTVVASPAPVPLR